MKLKYLLIPATVLSITLSGTAVAKKPEGKGNPHSGGPDARWENSNKQSDEHSLRGQDRAEERHRLKESKKHKKNKHKYKKDKYHDKNKYDKKYDKHDRRHKDKYYDRDDRYDRKHDRSEQRRDNDRYDRRDKDEYYERGDDRYKRDYDRYERQRDKERYQNNPLDTTIDRNINDAKSIIDDAHRKTIESIDNTSKELTGDGTRRDRTKSARPWWSIFGEE